MNAEVTPSYIDVDTSFETANIFWSGEYSNYLTPTGMLFFLWVGLNTETTTWLHSNKIVNRYSIIFIIISSIFNIDI